MAKFSESNSDIIETQDSNDLGTNSPDNLTVPIGSAWEASDPIDIPVSKKRSTLRESHNYTYQHKYKPIPRKYFKDNDDFDAYEKARTKTEPLQQSDFRDQSVFEDYQDVRKEKTDYSTPLIEDDFICERDYKIYLEARTKNKILTLEDFFVDQDSCKAYEKASIKAEPLQANDFGKNGIAFLAYQSARELKPGKEPLAQVDFKDFLTVPEECFIAYERARTKSEPLKLLDFGANVQAFEDYQNASKFYQAYQVAQENRQKNWFTDYAEEMGTRKTTPDDRHVGREERRRELQGSGAIGKDAAKTIGYL